MSDPKAGAGDSKLDQPEHLPLRNSESMREQTDSILMASIEMRRPQRRGAQARAWRLRENLPEEMI